MKIVGLSIVKNEEDVIELFVRHNLNFLDELHILNHQSSDNTGLILSLLADEGLPLKLQNSNHSASDRSRVISSYAKEVFTNVDRVVLLDADEFIFCESRKDFEIELEKISVGNAGLLRWKTYLPPESSGNLLKQARVRRLHEFVDYGKVIVHGSHYLNGTTSLGNHGAHDPSGKRIPMVELNVTLAHFPIRNSAQIVSKIILGAHTVSLSSELSKDQGEHWFQIAEQIRASNYELSFQELKQQALSYCNTTDRLNNEVIEDPVPYFKNVEIKYPKLIQMNVLRSFDQYIAQNIAKLNQAKSIATLIRSL